MIESLCQFIDDHEKEMLSLLRRLVLIQSGTRNKQGVDAVVDTIESFLKSGILRLERLPQKHFGDHLLAVSPGVERHARGILITGHTDTVFPADTSFNWYREDDDRVYGPGVIDMKGGLVVGIFAIMALDAVGLLESMPIRFLFNSDEEVGSPSSKALIEKLARKSDCGFVLECGGLGGAVVTGRKGRLGLKVETMGKAGHAAFVGTRKSSAILELCHQVIALEAMNKYEDGITVNVGQVEGGIGPNTVAQQAIALVDVRYAEPEQKNHVLDQISRQIAHNSVPGVTAHLTIEGERPSMPQTAANRQLFSIVAAAAALLDIKINEEFRQGVSDANLIASQGTPVIDGLGPVGADDHSDKEYMIKKSLVERARLFSVTLLETWRRYYNR